MGSETPKSTNGNELQEIRTEVAAFTSVSLFYAEEQALFGTKSKDDIISKGTATARGSLIKFGPMKRFSTMAAQSTDSSNRESLKCCYMFSKIVKCSG
jgi:hypothetical protein